jgi:hypothetical protein
MKLNELEIYKALKVLTESGYIISENRLVTENRTFDVEELVTKYKARIMKLLRQKLTQMLDKVYDGEDVEKTITIEIPALMVPVTYRPEPVRMKALTVKLYGDKKDIRSDYDAQKGRGKGALYANAMGDTNPDTDPVILMINLPNVISAATTKTAGSTTKGTKKITEGKYTSRKINTIPFPKAREKASEGQEQVDRILANLEKNKGKKKTATPTTGRTAERDALYARFRDRYGSSSNGYYGSYGYGGYGYGGNYGYSSYTYVDDSFKFKDAVEEVEADAETPMQVVDKIMEEYFGDFFQEVLHHELTHYIQANNKQLDGTEDAHDYDAHQVMASGAYASDELEYEAKLHQKLPDYIDAIQRSKNSVSKIAKNLVTKLFSNQFNKLPKAKQQKYFDEILKLCQVIKTHPEITKHNFNKDKINKLIRDAL